MIAVCDSARIIFLVLSSGLKVCLTLLTLFKRSNQENLLVELQLWAAFNQLERLVGSSNSEESYRDS